MENEFGSNIDNEALVIKPKFRPGDKVVVIESDSRTYQEKCPDCLGFGTVRKMESYTKRFGSVKGFHGPANTCTKCMRAGYISRKEHMDWKLNPKIYIVYRLKCDINSKCEFSIDKVGCNSILEADSEGLFKEALGSAYFDEKDCFHSSADAKKEIEKRNMIPVICVTFSGNTYLFTKEEEVATWSKTFLLNAMKQFVACKVDDKDLKKSNGRYEKLLEHAESRGVKIETKRMKRSEYENVPTFGGVKVLNGSPEYVDILFGTKEIQTVLEDSVKVTESPEETFQNLKVQNFELDGFYGAAVAEIQMTAHRDGLKKAWNMEE